MSTRTRRINWTDQSILQIVSREVSNSPGNLTAAFKRIAKQLGCSPLAVSNRWYSGTLKNDVGFQFATGNDKTSVINRKNIQNNHKQDTMIHQVELNSRIVEGMKVVTVRQYYAI